MTGQGLPDRESCVFFSFLFPSFPSPHTPHDPQHTGRDGLVESKAGESMSAQLSRTRSEDGRALSRLCVCMDMPCRDEFGGGVVQHINSERWDQKLSSVFARRCGQR